MAAASPRWRVHISSLWGFETGFQRRSKTSWPFLEAKLREPQAAARMNDIRQKILETLAGLSKTIDLSEDYLQIYRQDEELFRRAEDLYVVLLKGIEAMMDWLDHKTYSKKHICSGLYRC